MKVILYSLESCPNCIKVKKYLENKKIKFEYVNLTHDRNRAIELHEKSGNLSVPILDVDGIIIKGYTPEDIELALSIKQTSW